MPEGVEVLLTGESLQNFFQSKDVEEKGYVEIFLEKVYSDSVISKSNISFSNFNSIFTKLLYKDIFVFGKNIFVPSSNNHVMVIQLGMSGSFSEECSAHSRLKFLVDREHPLYYDDVRKFGSLTIQEEDHLKDRTKLLLENALEWREEKTPIRLYPKIHKRHDWSNQEIKNDLLNQFIIAGVGNIYASEALFRAKIHPKRKAGSLSKEECFLLGSKCQEIMWQSYALGGMSIRTFSNFNKKGDGKKLLYVYNRCGSICQVCEKALIQKIKQNGRSTYFCPNCQMKE